MSNEQHQSVHPKAATKASLTVDTLNNLKDLVNKTAMTSKAARRSGGSVLIINTNSNLSLMGSPKVSFDHMSPLMNTKTSPPFKTKNAHIQTIKGKQQF